MENSMAGSTKVVHVVTNDKRLWNTEGWENTSRERFNKAVSHSGPGRKTQER
jgi:hypothetical protein